MSPLSNLPGPWRWEQRGDNWWRIHDRLNIEDGPHPAPERVVCGLPHPNHSEETCIRGIGHSGLHDSGFLTWGDPLSDERVLAYDRNGTPEYIVAMTKTGRVLTEADLNALAEEAEAGYDARIKFWDCPENHPREPQRVRIRWDGDVATCLDCGRTNRSQP